MRAYREFTHKDARLRVHCQQPAAVKNEIVRQRALLEAYLKRHPAFGASFTPVPVLPGAPEVARRMARAAAAAGVGPMAAVAGAMAQLAAEAGLAAGAAEAIVENGGDIFAAAADSVTVRLDAGGAGVGAGLAFRIPAAELPLAVCSSSGAAGRSISLGACHLATVTARDAALADAAATQAANLVRGVEDIDAALVRIRSVPGVEGVLIAHGNRVGLGGHLPPLVRFRGCPARARSG